MIVLWRIALIALFATSSSCIAQSAEWDRILALPGADWLSEAEVQMRIWPEVDSDQTAVQKSGEVITQEQYRTIATKFVAKLNTYGNTMVRDPWSVFEQEVSDLLHIRDHLSQRASYVNVILVDFIERYTAVVSAKRALTTPEDRSRIRDMWSRFDPGRRDPDIYSGWMLRERLIATGEVTSGEVSQAAKKLDWDENSTLYPDVKSTLIMAVRAERMKGSAGPERQHQWASEDTPLMYGSATQLIEKQRPYGLLLSMSATWTLVDLQLPLAVDLLNRLPKDMSVTSATYASIKEKTNNLRDIKVGTAKDPFRGAQDILGVKHIMRVLERDDGILNLINTPGTVPLGKVPTLP
ncbi:MAG TPA: hypothetical protein VM120_25940 [Bryobacteraceae bacterium]|nr:hypothetical protein [Bryobacteraceae bacterium]